MRTNLFLLTILIGLSLSTILKAENVLYCKSELATGFYKENNTWKEGSFKRERFTIKFNEDYTKLEGASYKPFYCSLPLKFTKPENVYCVESGEVFIYNRTTTRFLYSSLSSGGFIDNSTDTENLYAGSCQKF